MEDSVIPLLLGLIVLAVTGFGWLTIRYLYDIRAELRRM